MSGLRNMVTSSKPPSKLFLMLAAIGIAVGFSAISASIFREMGERDYQYAYQSASVLTTSVSSDVERNIEIYDLSIRQVITALSKPAILALEPESRNLAVFDGSAEAKHFGPMMVLDVDGRVLMHSREPAAEKQTFRDYDFFTAHLTNANAGLFISRPWVTAQGEYVISLSRQVSQTDGSFGGVVVGNIGLGYFHDLFRRLHFGRDDSMALLNTDGTVLMRYPFSMETIGKSINSVSLATALSKAPNGAYRSVSEIDGVEKLFAYRQVGNLPLLTVQGTSIESIFAEWYRQLWTLSALLVVLSVLTLALVYALATALKHRHSVELRLAMLAATDGLTGLRNRRQFDEALEIEWRRALRTRSRLALILVDVDHFKSFNDMFGHQAGDHALVTVAQCISDSTRRGGDLSARYGGEEFAVLLPDTDTQGAMEVAETIRTNVFALRDNENGHKAGTPTVSLGVVSLVPHEGLSPTDLVKSADLALYDAKRDGRNRTVRASVLPFPQRLQEMAAAG